MPPVPDGTDFTEYVARRWAELMPEAQADPNWDTASWLPIFAAEREAELAAVYKPYGGPFNRARHHVAWDDINVDHMLAQHGYVLGRPPRGHWRRPQYLSKSPPVRQTTMRSAGIVFRPVALKKGAGFRVPKKESGIITPKEPGAVPQRRLYPRRPTTPPPTRTDMAEEYLRL
jgi:hypothetical protein